MSTPLSTRKRGFLIGITGSAGSGKTAVGNILTKLGYTVLSADQFARTLTEIGSPVLAEIQVQIGHKFFHADGSLNRKLLREEITASEETKNKLEAILHPRIQNMTLSESEKRFDAGETIVFYEAPVLFEAKSEKKMDFVLCVWAQEKILIERICQRDAVSAESAKKLLGKQMPQEEKKSRSQFHIENSGTLADLEINVSAFLKELKNKVGVT